MAMTPLYKPAVPCKAPLNGMFVGKWVYVCGRSLDDADRFVINLFCGPDDNDDIALHFNPRFGQNEVVRNTRRGGWQGEEKDGGFPFKQGQLFGVTITCRKDGYEIRANRFRTFATFKHRISFCEVTHVGVSEKCEVMLVTSGIEGVDVPLWSMENPSPGDFELPFHNIRERTVVIVGVPTNQNGRMDINFVGKAKGIHLHYNPRLNEQQIVRNTKGPDGRWGAEERDMDMKFPFVEGIPFVTKIRVQRKKYVVEINGVWAFEYKKRIRQLKFIRGLSVHNDIDIKAIKIY